MSYFPPSVVALGSRKEGGNEEYFYLFIGIHIQGLFTPRGCSLLGAPEGIVGSREEGERNEEFGDGRQWG